MLFESEFYAVFTGRHTFFKCNKIRGGYDAVFIKFTQFKIFKSYRYNNVRQ